MSYSDYLVQAKADYQETKELLHLYSSTDINRRNAKILLELKLKTATMKKDQQQEENIKRLTIVEATELLQQCVNQLSKHGYTLDIKVGIKEINKVFKQ